MVGMNKYHYFRVFFLMHVLSKIKNDLSSIWLNHLFFSKYIAVPARMPIIIEFNILAKRLFEILKINNETNNMAIKQIKIIQNFFIV